MRPRAPLRSSPLGTVRNAVCMVGLVWVLADCGGSDNTTSSSTPTTVTTSVTNYTLGGTISGLASGSVVLANGSHTVTVAAGATSWMFSDSFAPGSSYSVTVHTQPTDEICAVTSGGGGKNTGNVDNVTVACGFGQWIWKAGLKALNGIGVYGTQGTASAGSVPGARYGASSWTDAAGEFWLFGGVGYDATGATGYLNDLWRYSPATGQWTWFSGGNVDNAAGIYGTKGSAAAGNCPGARQAASAWIDSSGNLWLFGGVGYSAASAVGNLNDLWRYSPSSGLWTWVSGGDADNATGIYGTKGNAAAGNIPGARYSASAWIDSSGNLWLFGGFGYAAAGTAGELGDLWEYSSSTKEWTWASGKDSVNGDAEYGTLGTASASNLPGARYAASQWTDSSGNLWLFGGYGYASTGTAGKLSDLWEYVPGTKEWTWVSGNAAANVAGIYDTLGTADSTTLPGGRQAASSWTDSSGNLWLFGGVGYDAFGKVGNLNDLWQYSPSASEWTWFSGGFQAAPSGIYGTQGTALAGDVPGGRNASSSWIDSSGRLWLFGGSGYDSTGSQGYLNDLWQYTPGTGS